MTACIVLIYSWAYHFTGKYLNLNFYFNEDLDSTSQLTIIYGSTLQCGILGSTIMISSSPLTNALFTCT